MAKVVTVSLESMYEFMRYNVATDKQTNGRRLTQLTLATSVDGVARFGRKTHNVPVHIRNS